MTNYFLFSLAFVMSHMTHQKNKQEGMLLGKGK